MQRGDMICGNCGWYNPDESRFCVKCREPLVAVSHTTERNPEHGKRARLILGLFVPLLLLIILAVAIPNFMRSRIGDERPGPVGSLRALITAETTYATQNPGHGYLCLQELGSAGLIDPRLASGTRVGYRYVITECEGELPHKTYTIMAYPLQPSKGQHTFCTRENGVIHAADPGASLETCLQSGTVLR